MRIRYNRRISSVRQLFYESCRILNAMTLQKGCMSADSLDSGWSAIQTQSWFEQIVLDQLAGQGVEPLLPVRKRVSQWNNRTKVIEVALFAGCYFSCFSLAQQGLILQIPGVVESVGHRHGLAAVVNPGEIAAMQRLVASALPS